MSMERDRLHAVAKACASRRYVLEIDPKPQDIDYDEARRFIAMMAAYKRFGPPSSYWEIDLDDRITKI
jgi:hypothetical protein